MKHVVLSTDASGQPKIDEVDTLDEALQLVERLRNDAAVDDVRVLREVPIEVRTYYKVVAVEDTSADAAAGSGAVATPPPPPVAAPADASADHALAGEVAAAASGSDEVPTSSPTDEPRPANPADDGFFTPPPVRSHAVEVEEDEGEADDSPSERRTSLFGRG